MGSNQWVRAGGRAAIAALFAVVVLAIPGKVLADTFLPFVSSGSDLGMDFTGVSGSGTFYNGTNYYGVYPDESTTSGGASGGFGSYGTEAYFFNTSVLGDPGDYWMKIVITGDDTYYTTYSYDGVTVSPGEFGAATTTRIIQLNLPENNDTFTSTTTIEFDFDWYNGEETSIDRTGVELLNLTLGSQSALSEQIIAASGANTYTATTTLSNALYQWRPYMRSTTDPTERINGEWRFFSVGVEGNNFEVFPGATDDTASCEDSEGVLGGTLCRVMTFLFIPSPAALAGFQSINTQLQTKFPFAYAYDFKNSLETLYTTATTQSLTIEMDFAGLGDLTLLSADQIAAVPYTPWIKTMMGYLMWIMFSVAMYRRTLRIFDSNTAT